MGRRSKQTRRQWLAACGGATTGVTGLAGCTGSSDDSADPESTGSNGDADNGGETTENGTDDEGSASPSEGSWPMSQFTASNQMVTDEWSGPDAPLEEGWTVEIGVREVSAPVIDHGLVYVADETSMLHAIDLASGETEWTYEPELPPGTPPNPQWEPTTPAVTDDAVYFLTETLYVLDPEEGDVLWSVELGSLYSGHIRVYDDIVYIHNDGTLYAIDINEEEVIWEEENASSTQDIAVGDDGTFYAIRRTDSETNYEVMAFNVVEDETIWTYSPSENVSAGFGLMVRDRTVYTQEPDRVLSIDGETGDPEKLAEYEQTEAITPTGGIAPTIADGTIYSGGSSRYPAVLAAEVETGEEPDTWNSDTLADGPSRRTFVSADTLYVWRNPGYVDLDALDPKTGERKWTTETTEHIDIIGERMKGYAILDDAVVFTAYGNTAVVGSLK